MRERYNASSGRNSVSHFKERTSDGAVLRHREMPAWPTAVPPELYPQQQPAAPPPLTTVDDEGPVSSPTARSCAGDDTSTATDVLPCNASLVFDAVETPRCNADLCSSSFSPIQAFVGPIDSIERTCQRAEPAMGSYLGYQTVESKGGGPPRHTVDNGAVDRIFQRQAELNQTLHALTAKLSDLLHEEWALTGRIPEEYPFFCAKPVQNTSFPLSKRLINRANTISHGTAPRFDIRIHQSATLTEVDSQMTERSSTGCSPSRHCQNRSLSSESTTASSDWPCAVSDVTSHVTSDNHNGQTVDLDSEFGDSRRQKCAGGDTVNLTGIPIEPSACQAPNQGTNASTSSVDGRLAQEGCLCDAEFVVDSFSHVSGQVDRDAVDFDATVYHRKLLQYARYELELRRLEVDWAVVTELHAVHKKRAGETKLDAYKVAYKSNARKLQEILSQMKRIRENMAGLNLTNLEGHPALLPFNYEETNLGFRQRRLTKPLRLRSTEGSRDAAPQTTVTRKKSELLHLSDVCHARSSPATPNRRVSKMRNVLMGVLPVSTPPPSLASSDSCQSIDRSASGVNSVACTDWNAPGRKQVNASLTRGKPRRVSLVSFMHFFKAVRGRTRSPACGSLNQTPTVAETPETDHLKAEHFPKPSRCEEGRGIACCSDWADNDTGQRVTLSNAVPTVVSNSTFHRPTRVLSRCKSMPVRLAKNLDHYPLEACLTRNNVEYLSIDPPRTAEFLCHKFQRLTAESDVVKQENQRFPSRHENMKGTYGQRPTSSPLADRWQKLAPFEETISMLPLTTANCARNESTTSLSRYNQPASLTKISQISSISSNCSTSGCSCLSSPTTVSSSLAFPDHRVDPLPVALITPVPNSKADGSEQTTGTSVQLRSPEFRGRCHLHPCRHIQAGVVEPSDLEVKCICSCVSQYSDKDSAVSSGCRAHESCSTSECSPISTDGSARAADTPVNQPRSTSHNPKRMSIKPFLALKPSGNRTGLDVSVAKPRRMSTSLTRYKRLPRHSLLPSHPSTSLTETHSTVSSTASGESITLHPTFEKSTAGPLPEATGVRAARRSLSQIIWPGQKFRCSIRTALHPLKYHKPVTLTPCPSQPVCLPVIKND